MSSTTTSAIYDNKSQANYKSWNRSILRKFDSHPDKLLPVVTKGKLDVMYRAKFRNAVYNNDTTDDLDVACAEQLKSCNNSAYLIIIETISCKTTLSHIEREFDSDGNKAYEYIRDLWKVDDNENRIDRVKNERDALIKNGMANGTCKAATAYVEELLRLNDELNGSTYHLEDAALVKDVLSQLSRFHATTVNAYRAAKVSVKDWKKDFAKMWTEVADLLESQDSDAKVQHGPTDVLTISADSADPADPMAEMRALLADAKVTIEKQQQQISILATAPHHGGGGGGPGGPRRDRSELAACPDCGKKHAIDPTHGCTGKAVAEGRITVEEAAKRFHRSRDPTGMVEQVRRSYVVHQFDKGNKAPGATKPAATGFRPGKTIDMMPVDIVATNIATTPAGATTVLVDTMAQVTLLTNRAFFHNGVDDAPEHIFTLGGIAGVTALRTEGHGMATFTNGKGTSYTIPAYL